MKKDEIIKIVQISMILGIIITGGYLGYKQDDISLETIFRAIGVSSTSVTILWGVYFKWGWKIPLINNVLHKPNINGTWKGELKSDWKDESGKNIRPKTIFVVIRQSFLKIHFSTYTDKFIGVSYLESFIIDDSKGIKKIVYLYKKDTSDIGVQKNNQGVCELRILENNKQRLEGLYWTNIKTNGSLKLEKILDKYIESFEEGINHEIKE